MFIVRTMCCRLRATPKRGPSPALCGCSAAAAAVSLLLALAAPAALATEPTSGYGQEPSRPQAASPPPEGHEPEASRQEVPPTSTEPSKPEIRITSSPSSEEAPRPERPANATVAEQAGATPPASDSAKPRALPFTGFDLRWIVGMGILLTGAGCLILVLLRRHPYSG